MDHSRTYSTHDLLIRSFLPSAISAMLCLLFSIAVIGLHLVLLSLSLGTSLPTFLDGEWGLAYTNNIVQPLETIFNNLAFNNILIIGLWGFVGLATYFLIEYIVHVRRGWREAQDDIQMVGERRIVLHPARSSFVTTVLWRMGVLVAAAVLFILSQPVLQRLVSADPHIVSGSLSLRTTLFKLILALLGWAIFAHICVVLLRLFTMRTRLFGDTAIE